MTAHSADAAETPRPVAGESTLWRALLAVGAASLAIRLAVLVLWPPAAPTIADAVDYDRLARRMLAEGDFAAESGRPISLRPPLYPLAVAGVYALCGEGDVTAVAVYQIVLSLMTIPLVYVCGREAYSASAGVAAAAIYGCYPTLIAFDHLVLSEVQFVFLFAAGVAASTLMLRRATPATAVALGLALGLGALTRSILWLFGPPLCVYLALALRGGLARRVGPPAIALAVTAAVIAPWAIRNSRLHETFVAVDVMGGRNVMMGNYEHTPLERSWATVTTKTGAESWLSVLRSSPGYPEGPKTQGQIDKLAAKYGIRYFFTHPAESAVRCAVRFFNFWQLDRTVSAGLRDGSLAAVSTPVWLITSVTIAGYYASVAFAAVFGACLRPPDDRRVGLLFGLWVAFPCVIHTVAFAHSRYHLPCVPVLAVLAGGLATAGAARLRKTPAWRRGLAVAACGLLAAGWLRELIMVDFADRF